MATKTQMRQTWRHALRISTGLTLCAIGIYNFLPWELILAGILAIIGFGLLVLAVFLIHIILEDT